MRKVNKKTMLQSIRQQEQSAQKRLAMVLLRSVIAVEKSRDSKTGLCAATYAAQQTCPPSCPLLNKGCYAQKGHTGIHTSRLNKASTTLTPNQIAAQEARKVRTLAKSKHPLNLRLHVVGDCADRRSARKVSRASRFYARKTGRLVWTYTHAWQSVPRRDWEGVSVLASVSNVDEIEQAREQGYAPAIVVQTFPGNTTKAFTLDGSDCKFIPCPQQTGKSKDCQQCGLCFNTDRLFQANMGIAFKKH